jgi:hypothetical protein
MIVKPCSSIHRFGFILSHYRLVKRNVNHTSHASGMGISAFRGRHQCST